MFSFLNSFGASTNFEKYRLILTTKNYDAPDQTSLKKIIETFRGEDQETRSQIAFATIIKKLHTSDSSDNWIYLLKNLTIFDRVVEENCFLQQIATLNLKPIENYHQKDQLARALNSQNILKSYWNLIQYKSSLLSQSSLQKGSKHLQVPQSQKRDNTFSKTSSQHSNSKNKNLSQNFSNWRNQNMNEKQRSILSVFRSQKQQFLKTLSVYQIYKQSVQLQRLFDLIFRVIISIEPYLSNLMYRQSFFTGLDGQLSQKKSMTKSTKDIQLSPRQAYKVKNQGDQLLENLLPFNSMPDVLRVNNEYNQKYKSVREQFFNSKVINYLHLQLLYKLLSCYSNQLICVRTFIAHLMQHTNPNGSSVLIESVKNMKKFQSQRISEKQVILWKKIISNYLSFSQKIVNYVEAHKTIKGFQLINYQQLSPFMNVNILALLDNYIDHKNTLQEPDLVKVEDLGMIMDINNHIKVQKKAHWSGQKALTARKMVFPSRNLKDKNNAFFNWHNSYSSNFPPKEVLTIDLLMEIRQNPHNPACQMSEDDDDQSIYQPFLINRHSCIYNFRQSSISAASEFEFIPLEELKRKEKQKMQCVGSKKQKNFYYFRSDEKEKQFKNIYSSLTKQVGSVWVK